MIVPVRMRAVPPCAQRNCGIVEGRCPLATGSDQRQYLLSRVGQATEERTRSEVMVYEFPIRPR